MFIKSLLKTIILAAVTISCGNSSIKDEKKIVIDQDLVITKEETSVELNNEQTKQSIEDIEECIFDLKTQTDDFIKRITSQNFQIINGTTRLKQASFYLKIMNNSY